MARARWVERMREGAAPPRPARFVLNLCSFYLRTMCHLCHVSFAPAPRTGHHTPLALKRLLVLRSLTDVWDRSRRDETWEANIDTLAQRGRRRGRRRGERLRDVGDAGLLRLDLNAEASGCYPSPPPYCHYTRISCLR